MRLRHANTLLLVFIALILAVGYLYTVTDRCVRGAVVCADNMNPLIAPAPFRYRVLAITVQSAVAPLSDPDRAYLVDAVIHALLVAVLVPGLYQWFTRWLDAARALMGVLIVALCFMLAFQFYMPFGTTIYELVILVYALYAIDKSLPIYAALLTVAALNRETSLLLVALYVAWHGRVRWKAAFALLALWAGITISLHLVLGAAPHIYGLRDTFQRNISSLPQAILFNLPFLVLWGIVIMNYRPSAPLFKRFTWVALVYGAAVLVGAAWVEIRVLLPLLPIMLPIVLT